MNDETIKQKLLGFIAGLSFSIFLWASSLTAEEYWAMIAEQESTNHNQ